VLFVDFGRLRCWSLVEDELVWEYKGQPDWYGNFSVKRFAAEVVEGGQAARIVICVSRTDSELKFVDFVCLEFSKATRQLLTRCQIPLDSLYNYTRTHCDICGDFGVVVLDQPWKRTVMLFKISTGVRRQFKISGNVCRVKLIPGFMILSKIDHPLRELALGVWNVDSLIQSDSGDLKHETPLVYEVVSPDGCDELNLSTLSGTIITLKYHLSLYPVAVRFKGTLTVTGMFYFFGISYAGYMSGVDLDGSVYRYIIRDMGALFSSTPAKDLALPIKGKPLSRRVKEDPRSFVIVRDMAPLRSGQLTAYTGVWAGIGDNRVMLRFYP